MMLKWKSGLKQLNKTDLNVNTVVRNFHTGLTFHVTWNGILRNAHILLFCSSEFKDSFDFHKHQKKTHSVDHGSDRRTQLLEKSDLETQRFLRPKFGRTFNQKFNLDQHINAKHQTRKPVSCRLCLRIFVSELSLLKHHKYVHQQLGLSPCDICDFVAKRKANLRIHMMTKHSTKYAEQSGIWRCC